MFHLVFTSEYLYSLAIAYSRETFLVLLEFRLRLILEFNDLSLLDPEPCLDFFTLLPSKTTMLIENILVQSTVNL